MKLKRLHRMKWRIPPRMKIVVAVVVYDRLVNIEHWIRAWKLCKKQDCSLYVIHNYRTTPDIPKYQSTCEMGGVGYISRSNVGMDIGAFQDVCRERLEGFPNDWDYLFWATDDILPMNKRFLSSFINLLRKKPNVGASCLEISHEVKTHIRTSGFMISKDIANKLTFAKDRLETKDDCYDFEHRGANAFYEQLRKMGKTAMQVEPDLKKAPLWDSHIRAHLRRYNEHFREFPK
jgi:hypothetical protein